MRRTWLSSIVLLALFLSVRSVAQRLNPPPASRPSNTQVVMLGTGTPGFDIARSGPATAIVVNGTAYLVDFGAGVMRRAQGAYEKGVLALKPTEINVAFLTHLHWDHTTGYADLIYSPAQTEPARKGALEVYGPEGIRHMTEHLIEAYTVRRPLSRRGNPDVQVNVHEVTAGAVYKDKNVTVTAFPVKHRDNIAYGYRFQTADRSIVISGDTSPAESIVETCNGCDVLIHEAYSMFTYNFASPEDQANIRALHTSSVELAEIARRARPGLLILYHRSALGGAPEGNPEGVLLKEIRAVYRGKVVTGHDLDIY
ncbi:MAG TPA: MBL fold metallo-hydrolase [Vicinamibacterales bacterium]|nr:MBL fold metallo-hydrolase [Vicinamibacterales bacterium]